MPRRVCLCIGVSTVTSPKNQAMQFPFLDGAVLAAQAIGLWAIQTGFGESNVRVIDDRIVDGRPLPVTLHRVRTAVSELFPADAEPVSHLILSFCGHGLTDEHFGSISWLFSDSLKEKYRVVADRFYAELLLYGIERITLITDACREPPSGLDLTRLDAIRGIVVEGTSVRSPRFDQLAACQDGRQGYMVSDPMTADAGKCIFSGVIMDVLWGVEPTAIVNGQVTTTSAGSCVRSLATERAEMYSLVLNPQCHVDPIPAVLYDTRHPPSGRPDLQPWPTVTNVRAVKKATADLQVDEEVRFSLSEDRHEGSDDDSSFVLLSRRSWSSNFDMGTRLRSLKSSWRLRWLRRLSIKRKHRVSDFTGRHLDSSLLRHISATDVLRSTEFPIQDRQANVQVLGQAAKPWRRKSRWYAEYADDGALFRAAPSPDGLPAFVELSDGRVVPFVPYDRLRTTIVASATEEVFLTYGSPLGVREGLEAVKTIGAFAAGLLRSSDVERLAHRLRIGKHLDPMLGVVCAYLYRATADVDSIRRMAYFYFAHGQPVPFDIALLGEMAVSRDETGALRLHVPAVATRDVDPANLQVELPYFVTQATSQVVASIGGRCPWLGLGWDYVGDPRPNWAPLVEGLSPHAPRVSRRGITVLSKSIGRRLAKRWEREESRRNEV
jgi:hypothetical protein